MWIKFLLKETTGAFVRARTHDRQSCTDYESDALPTATRRPIKTDLTNPMGQYFIPRQFRVPSLLMSFKTTFFISQHVKIATKFEVNVNDVDGVWSLTLTLISIFVDVARIAYLTPSHAISHT